jgi:hypothetical protein
MQETEQKAEAYRQKPGAFVELMSTPKVNGENSRLNISGTEVDRDRGLSLLERADAGASFFLCNVRDKVLLKLVIRKKHDKA